MRVLDETLEELDILSETSAPTIGLPGAVVAGLVSELREYRSTYPAMLAEMHEARYHAEQLAQFIENGIRPGGGWPSALSDYYGFRHGDER